MTGIRDVEAELRFHEQRRVLGIQHSTLLNAEEAAEYQAWRRERVEGRVVSYDGENYRPPHFLSKVVGQEEADQLQSLLLQVKHANDEVVGEQVKALEILRNGDPEILEVSRGLCTWAERYTQQRLRRGHPKDRGEPLRTYRRIAEELTPFFYSLAGQSCAIHHLFLGELNYYLPWLLFRGTWADEITVTRTEGWHLQFGRLDSIYHPICAKLLLLYGWVDSGHEWVLKAAGEGGGTTQGDATQTLERLALLAENIDEMRPFLVRNFRPEKTLVQVAEELHVAWEWSLNHHSAVLFAGNTERQVLNGIHTNQPRHRVVVDSQGRVCNKLMPWLRVDQLPGGVSLSIRMVEAMHDKLLSFYAQIDLDAILGSRDRASASFEEDTDDDNEVIAATIKVLRRQDGQHSVRLSARSQQVFSVLTQLGCEVSQGKGSEIKIYRPGAKIFTVGRHKRNERLGWSLIRRMLKRLEIPVHQWVAAVS